jgi:hypothetical protein
MTVNKLNEAASLSRRNLDVGNLAKPLEEGPQLVLCNVTGESPDKNSGVVRISELVHLHRTEGSCTLAAVAITGLLLLRRLLLLLLLHPVISHRAIVMLHSRLRSRHHLRTSKLVELATTALMTTILRSSWRDAHGSVSTIDALHLIQCLTLVFFVTETNKSVAPRLSCLLVCHDLGRLAGRVSWLKQCYENELVDFVAKISDKNGVLGRAIIPAVDETTAGGPVEPEDPVGVRNWRSIQL